MVDVKVNIIPCTRAPFLTLKLNSLGGVRLTESYSHLEF